MSTVGGILLQTVSVNTGMARLGVRLLLVPHWECEYSWWETVSVSTVGGSLLQTVSVNTVSVRL